MWKKKVPVFTDGTCKSNILHVRKEGSVDFRDRHVRGRFLWGGEKSKKKKQKTNE